MRGKCALQATTHHEYDEELEMYSLSTGTKSDGLIAEGPSTGTSVARRDSVSRKASKVANWSMSGGLCGIGRWAARNGGVAGGEQVSRGSGKSCR